MGELVLANLVKVGNFTEGGVPTVLIGDNTNDPDRSLFLPQTEVSVINSGITRIKIEKTLEINIPDLGSIQSLKFNEDLYFDPQNYASGVLTESEIPTENYSPISITAVTNEGPGLTCRFYIVFNNLIVGDYVTISGYTLCPSYNGIKQVTARSATYFETADAFVLFDNGGSVIPSISRVSTRTNTTITDVTRSWSVDELANMLIRIGPSGSPVRRIISNSAHGITFSSLPVVPISISQVTNEPGTCRFYMPNSLVAGDYITIAGFTAPCDGYNGVRFVLAATATYFDTGVPFVSDQVTGTGVPHVVYTIFKNGSYDSGTITSSDTTHITDVSKTWIVNELAGMVVVIGGIVRPISSNTASQITLSMLITPAPTGTFTIYDSNIAILTDNTKSWVTDVLAGKYIRSYANITGYSAERFINIGLVSSNTATEIITTILMFPEPSVLDKYSIYNLNPNPENSRTQIRFGIIWFGGAWKFTFNIGSNLYPAGFVANLSLNVPYPVAGVTFVLTYVIEAKIVAGHWVFSAKVCQISPALSSVSITSVTNEGSGATCRFYMTNTLIAGDAITIAGFTGSCIPYNGSKIVTVSAPGYFETSDIFVADQVTGTGTPNSPATLASFVNVDSGVHLDESMLMNENAIGNFVYSYRVGLGLGSVKMYNCNISL